MFVNWGHYIIPKCSFVLSYISNPLFIYLIHNNNQVILGPYRYLLYSFACFNMIAALVDFLIPLCVHNYRYAFITFLVDGPFSQRSDFGEQTIAFRSAFVSGTYGILNVHFVFRYLVLKKNEFITTYFMPYGLIFSIFYVILHWFIWEQIDMIFLHSTPESRDYIRDSINETFHEDIENINFVCALFSETAPDISNRSWAGILLLTAIASYSMILYVVLGYKIITGINKSLGAMSQKTAQMQKQLFKALTIQTLIPICVSFMPCSLCFYGAALKFEFPNWVYWGSANAVSMFPFLDPMAIIFFLPALRRRLGFRFRIGSITGTSTDPVDNN